MYEVGQWVAFRFGKEWYPGEVMNIADDEIEIKCMKIVGVNKFIWPDVDDVHLYDLNSVICSIEPPTPISQRAFGVRKNDLDKIKTLI